MFKLKKNLKENIVYYIVVCLFIICSLGPIIWCLIMSVTPESKMLSQSTALLPDMWTLSNYKEIFNINSRSHEVLFTGIYNSLIMAIITICICLPLTIITAYVFVRYKFKGKVFLMKLLLATIVIPVFTTIIPIYAIFAEYGMLDNLFWISVIYTTSFLPINTWIVVNYFKTIPIEIWQAAEIDGCNEWQIFSKVILRISIPIIMTSMLMIFLMSWSQFQIPLILTASQNNKSVTLIMSEFIMRDSINYGMISASGIISILFPVLISIAFRKLLVSGLSNGSVKG